MIRIDIDNGLELYIKSEVDFSEVHFIYASWRSNDDNKFFSIKKVDELKFAKEFVELVEKYKIENTISKSE